MVHSLLGGINMKRIIELVQKKHQNNGVEINPPAKLSDINNFEKQLGFALPTDFREFYLICNGFCCTEDLFNMVSLQNIIQYQQHFGNNWFYFSEYMIYSDMWGLRITPTGQYEIFNGLYPTKTITSSLTEFLQRFMKGNVFEISGLYEWHHELEIK